MGIIDTFMKMDGESFSIERNGTVVASVIGLMNHSKETGRKLCNFYPDTDVQQDDWIIREDTGERFYVDEIQNIRFNGKIESKDAYYLSEREYNNQKKESAAPPVFNIQNAYGSVIGTHNIATVNYNTSIDEMRQKITESDSPDKEELNQIVSLLEMVVNNQVPAQKGLFSRFSAAMERNSWITSSIAAAILTWLTTYLPQ